MTKKFFQKPIDNFLIMMYNIGTVKGKEYKTTQKEVIKNEL